jgi:DNA-binding transcriptional LysR family regulator
MGVQLERLESMSILVSAVEAGSLSAAARKLGVPLTTVSRKVSELERYLRSRLLIRSSRRLTLTDAGRSYVTACKRILEEVEAAERAATGEYSSPKGDLTVTAPIVFGRLHTLPVVTDFLEAYPEIDIRLTLVDRLVNLLDDHVDLAVRIGELPDSSLMATRVGAIRRVICGSPAYFAARGTPREPRDLVAHDCVTFEGLTSAKAWTFTRGKSDSPVAIRSRLTVNTAEAAIDAAIAGVGITRVLSYQIANARRAGALKVVLEEFEPSPWPVSLIYGEQGLLPLKLRAFIDYAAPRLKARLAQTA